MRETEIFYAPQWFLKNTTFVFKNIVQSDPDGWLRKNQTCLSALPRVIGEMIASSYKNSAIFRFLLKTEKQQQIQSWHSNLIQSLCFSLFAFWLYSEARLLHQKSNNMALLFRQTLCSLSRNIDAFNRQRFSENLLKLFKYFDFFISLDSENLIEFSAIYEIPHFLFDLKKCLGENQFQWKA